MAMKESRSNVQSPSNTDQKEEALSPKEVKGVNVLNQHG